MRQTSQAHRKVIVLLTCIASALLLIALSTLDSSAKERTPQQRLVPVQLLHAGTAAIVCDACPRSLGEAGKTAHAELLVWNRFEILNNRDQADLIFLFSANPYLGDYLTRDGPDTRPVRIDGVIMTVIDAHTGQELWSDSRRWGSWRVVGATKDLIEELRAEMETQVKRLTLDEIIQCSGVAPYQRFAFATASEALKTTELKVQRVPDATDRLQITSSSVPEFCRRAELIVDPDGRITRFEVLAQPSETLDPSQLLQQADQFSFVGGRNPQTQTIRFSARSKDGKIIIEFDTTKARPILSRVSYLY